jgi:hypothetical protein
VYMKDNAEYVYELIELAIESIYGEEWLLWHITKKKKSEKKSLY